MDDIADDVLDTVGRTPMVRLARFAGDGCELLAKLESRNPAGSVKDRAASAMVRAAEADGSLTPGATIIEATSGNTGISLAMIAAVRGYRCVLVMPEDMSLSRRMLTRAYGAEIVLTPALDGMLGAVRRARELLAATPGAFTLRQFDNPANAGAHERTTGAEVLAQTAGRVDAFVAGVGTGGTLMGVARALKRAGSRARIVAVEPAQSAVLSGGAPGPHGLQGIGAGFVPPLYDPSLVDEVVTVTEAEAERARSRLSREEGLLTGVSAGANAHAALSVGRRLGAGARVVTVLCDTGERYLY